MNVSVEDAASSFLEVSSEQRLKIISHLMENESNISSMAKRLGATVPEVHRNFNRLVKAGLIAKNTNGAYNLTEYGKVVNMQIPAIMFMSKNQKYFQTHSFGDLPSKFIQRIGALYNLKIINGYIKVQEKWNDIYKNAEKFICNILVEVSYEPKLMSTLHEKMRENISISSIFASDAIITKGRKEGIKEEDLKKFVEKGVLYRRMKKNVQIPLILNEKEAGICFPTSDGEPDLGKMLYSSDPDFQEYCKDYFDYCWSISGSFQEGKLRE